MATNSSYDFDILETYYTNQKIARESFAQLLASSPPRKSILAIHGIGGTGKSTLLRMYNLQCLKQRVPVGSVSSEVETTPGTILAGFAKELQSTKVRMREFSKVYGRYLALLAKVDQKTPNKLGAAGTFASKASEAAGGAVTGALVGSVVPGVGTIIGATLGSALGAMGTESITDWLSGFLDDRDLDLLLQPDEKLTRSFLSDLERAASKSPIVLMLDDFETNASLEQWAGTFCRDLPDSVIFVLSGRRIPKWANVWPEWLTQSILHELEPLSEQDMRTLVGRYYSLFRPGRPDPIQEDAIVRFARGSPLVINSTVQLWVEHDLEDFEAVRTEVGAVLAHRILEGIPSNLAETVQAAATLRWFNTDMLQALLPDSHPESSINLLSRFPFVQPRTGGGWTLHDLVREMILENMKAQSVDTFHKLHRRAIRYFTDMMARSQGDVRYTFAMERLYHELIVDETRGTARFGQLCEHLTRARLVDRLRTVLDQLETHQFAREENRLWRDYYVACLLRLEERTERADLGYQAILNSEHAEPRLRSYALCDRGSILAKREHLANRSATRDPTKLLTQSLEHTPLDAHLASSLLKLAQVSKWEGDGDSAIRYLEEARIFFSSNGDDYGLIRTVIEMKGLYVAQGNWREVVDLHAMALKGLARTDPAPHMAAGVHGDFTYSLALMGRFTEAEQALIEGRRLARESGDRAKETWFEWQLAYALGRQRRYTESAACFRASLALAKSLGDDHVGELVVIRGFEGEILSQQGRFADAADCLNFSVQGKLSMVDLIGVPEVLERLGSAFAAQGMWKSALEYYQSSLDANTYGLRYFEVKAKVGQCWALYHQGQVDEVRTMLDETAAVAGEYEYYDQLAVLRLLEGHLVWGSLGNLPLDGAVAKAQAKYEESLLLAMHYNRFLVDDVLSGDSSAHTYLSPIIPYCMTRGAQGRRILDGLKTWWDTAAAIGSPLQVDRTISLVDSTANLRHAERSARVREVGTASPQHSVVEQLNFALG